MEVPVLLASNVIKEKLNKKNLISMQRRKNTVDFFVGFFEKEYNRD